MRSFWPAAIRAMRLDFGPIYSGPLPHSNANRNRRNGANPLTPTKSIKMLASVPSISGTQWARGHSEGSGCSSSSRREIGRFTSGASSAKEFVHGFDCGLQVFRAYVQVSGR